MTAFNRAWKIVKTWAEHPVNAFKCPKCGQGNLEVSDNGSYYCHNRECLGTGMLVMPGEA